MLVNTKQETDNCGSTAVTDNLFMHSALPPATKTHSVIKLNYKKKWNLHKNRQAVKKVWQHEKSCEIQGDSPELVVMVG